MHSTLPLVAVLLIAASPAFSAPTGDLSGRAVIGCKSAFQCRNAKRPMNSDAVCVENACSYQCLAGFTDYGNRCVRTAALSWYAAPTATTTTTTTTTSSAPSSTIMESSTAPSATASATPSVLEAAGITDFLGINTNAILSWYDTNAGRDYTNGRGWCEWNYNNAIPGFAPSLKRMLANFGGDAKKAKEAYCGLEAFVTTPDGRNATLYVVDAFDDTWVITPSSLDIIRGSFAQLFGRETDSKLDVVKNASWSWTGNRRADFGYKSSVYQN
ncbi:hypothetical protein JCM11251_003140 [Rhodosporidiobolus azoricus]